MNEGGGITFHKGLQGDYLPVQYPGRNVSGLKPYGKTILVAVDEFATVSAAGVHMIDTHVEKMTASSTSGCIFALGAEAFRLFEDGTVWKGDVPVVGERVYFERYAGQLVMGHDGKTYRLMDYRAIAAGVDLDYVMWLAQQEPGDPSAENEAMAS